MILNQWTFPFTLIKAQGNLKLALQIVVVNPLIGGVMIMGDRGTGKSTTVRALAELLPTIEVIQNDPFNSLPKKEISSSELPKGALESQMGERGPVAAPEKRQKKERIRLPMVELPLGATEDRVCGTINLKAMLSGSSNVFEPGLLARANRGILYVDEINLLDDHLVDVLLDSAASGWNIVERDSVSLKHASKFILVGSGNREEGELRPQLLDRFGLMSEVRTIEDPRLRLSVVKERIAFDKNPGKWLFIHQEKQEQAKNTLVSAQSRLKTIFIADSLQLKVSQVCSELKVEGLRGDMACVRAATALAALEKRAEVSVQDIERTIKLCLRHRLRKDPLETQPSGERVQSVFKKVFKE